MAFLQQMRSPRLSFLQTLVSLFLATVALLSSYWCVGKQKVPKPLCTPTKHSNCIPVPGVSDDSSIQFSWETGDDRFVFPVFHTGLFMTCEENIYTDEWEEKCRGLYALTPGSEKGNSFPAPVLCIQCSHMCRVHSHDVAVSDLGADVHQPAAGQLHTAVCTAVHGCFFPLHAPLGPAAQRIRCSFHCTWRSAGHGGPHDVHAGVSDHSFNGTGGFQTSQLWILLGVLCGMVGFHRVHVGRSVHSQQLYQEGHYGGAPPHF